MLLGIDGGGSKTTALLANKAGLVLGRGYAGTSNIQVAGTKPAFAAIRQASTNAFIDAGRSAVVPAAVCLGLAGAGRAGDMALVRAWAATEWPTAALAVVNDAELVLAAGTPEGWGIGLICGTGSIAIARDQAGRNGRAGGWGYLFGDEGSGYAIGLAALQAVARAADGRGPATALSELILAHWKLREPHELISQIYTNKPTNRDIATLAAHVVQATTQGDTVAQTILDAACIELAGAAVAVARQLALTLPVPCALAGGLLVNTPVMAQKVVEAAEHQGVVLAPCTSVPDPAVGAISIAQRLLKAAA